MCSENTIFEMVSIEFSPNLMRTFCQAQSKAPAAAPLPPPIKSESILGLQCQTYKNFKFKVTVVTWPLSSLVSSGSLQVSMSQNSLWCSGGCLDHF